MPRSVAAAAGAAVVLIVAFASASSAAGGAVAAAAAAGAAAAPWQEEPEQCEPIRTELCANLRYNYTKMPNFFNHRSQSEAYQEMYQYLPIVSIVANCSVHLRFFLCSLFYPMCTLQHGGVLVVEACRSMCLQMRRDCERSLAALNVPWPQALHCDRLPDDGEGALCMQPAGATGGLHQPLPQPPAPLLPLGGGGGDRAAASAAVTRPGRLPTARTLSPPLQQQQPPPPQPTRASGLPSRAEPPADGPVVPDPASTGSFGGGGAACPPRFVAVDDDGGGGGGVPGGGGGGSWNNLSLACAAGEGVCSPACRRRCQPDCDHDVSFSRADKETARLLMAAWSTVCLLATLAAAGTLGVDPDRFRYPVRPVLFMALCHFLCTAAYLVRLLGRPEDVVCKQLSTGSRVLIVADGGGGGISGGGAAAPCVIVFLVQYYFGQAASAWWTSLSLAWFLAAGRKWSQEAIRSHACYLHVGAWGLPALQTVVALALGRVDGDELTGMCYVGAHDRTALLAFVLVPQAAHLALGASLILAGFVALFRVRRRLKSAAAVGVACDVRKLEKLMAKIGLFAAVYTVPALCVVMCLAYEYVHMDKWQCAVRQQPRCGGSSSGGAAAGEVCSIERSVPAVEIFIVKLFMSLAVGATTCMWALGPKTAASWRGFLHRCRRQRSGNGSARTVAERRSQLQPQLQQQQQQQQRLLTTPMLIVADKSGQRPPQCLLTAGGLGKAPPGVGVAEGAQL